ncbi:MAG TPA: hypothetical protein PLK24_03350 [Atribacter sp.]|uniref:hypothetical protein n=1 Tax=Atribacter sp. TaxID=2847780 RepID=UPI002BC94CF9|nr:hypothetical protein [Atribacter sp.]HQK82955.1 hypothetical protein [Atribacter sp.]
MNEITLSDMGLDFNPFDLTIAEEESIKRYTLYGREDQITRIENFVNQAINKKKMQKIIIRGEYGTGKTHHLLRLRGEINSGKYGNRVLAIYIGNLGVSIRRFYEVFIEQLKEGIPELNEFIISLPEVEPQESVDPGYKREKLRDNIIKNLSSLIIKLQYLNYEGIFLLVDEAEDIVQSRDKDEIQYFIQSLVHIVNNLVSYPLHIILGFSREALSKISNLDMNEPTESKIGDAFFQRFQQHEDIVLGYLSESDTKAMILDRLNSARTVRSDSFYPIHEGVISVVNTITGGHPREILSIMNKGIENALMRGVKEVDGECILQVLATHVQYFNKEVVLDFHSLDRISAKLGEIDDQLKSDFERLRGKLIGENGIVSASDFSKKKFAEDLTQPLDGIRILERQTNDVGKTFYVVHNDLKAEVFKGKRYSSKIEQLLDSEIIKIIQSPEKYQKQLVSGFWRLIQEECKGEFKQKVEIENSPIQKEIIVGKVRMPASSSNVSVAFTVFKGHEFPTDLFKKCISLMETKIAHFVCIIYDGPRFSADPHYNRLKNELREKNKRSFCENIVVIKTSDVSSDSNQVMGTLMLLGNREVKIDEKIDTSELLQQLKVLEKIETLVNKKALIYPEEELARRIIYHLAAHSLDTFSITDLKNKLDSQYINRYYLENLESQRFILKEGNRWRIATLDHDPPWKPLYNFISKQRDVTADQILQYLNEKYVLQCPPGNEEHMVQWYLEILMVQNMIIPTRKDGKNHYSLVDFSEKLEVHLKKCNEKFKELEESIKEAGKLRIEIGDFKIKLGGIKNKIERLQDKIEIGSKELTECTELLTEINTFHKDINKSINQKIDEYKSLVHKIEGLQKIFLEEIKNAFSEGFISEIEHEEWRSEIIKQFDQLNTHFLKPDYSTLDIDASNLEKQINQYRTNVKERKESKVPCTQLATRYTDLAKQCLKKLEDLARLGYEGKVQDGKTVKDLMDSLHASFQSDYTNLYNSGKFDSARKCISNIYSKTQDIYSQLNQAYNTYKGYEQRITGLEACVHNEADLKKILDEAREELKKWNFAILDIKLKEFEETRKKKTDQPKTPEDQFLESFKTHDTLTMHEVLKNYSVEDTFTILKNLYLAGKIKDINIKLK